MARTMERVTTYVIYRSDSPKRRAAKFAHIGDVSIPEHVRRDGGEEISVKTWFEPDIDARWARKSRGI